jgi:amidase
MHSDMAELIWESAASLAAAIHRGSLSAEALMAACYRQIERLNPRLNAIVNLLPEAEALELARAADRALARGEPAGPLHGIPMAAKDNLDASGFPTTMGFAPFANRMARADAELVARERAAGAIFIGKTNMPEFGLGSQTFNGLFGVTRNPWNPELTAGGSSGGAAAAVATGMLPLANGSDMGGSLRNPASFCSVVGLRPSIGRVPDPGSHGWFARLSTAGPMARTVADAALLLSIQAGPHPDDPLSLRESGHLFAGTLARDPQTMRIAWSAELPGCPVDPEVAAIVESAAAVFRDLGAEVTRDAPDLDHAMDVFRVQRGAALAIFARSLDAACPDWREHAKATAIWNIDQGLAQNGAELLRAEVRRAALYRHAARFFERYDALLLPAAQVPPFPAETEWVRSINGVPMSTYIDWMAVCCVISVLGVPAISVPAGFTAAGLPVGVQIAAAAHDDLGLLQIAHVFEQATRHHERRPPLAVAGTTG